MKRFLNTLLVTTAVVSVSLSMPALAKMQQGGQYQSGDNSNAQVTSGANADVRLLTRDDVKIIQKALNDRGYNPGSQDGVLGSQTTAAIRKFQRDNNLTDDGTIRASTLDRLNVQVSSYNGSTGNTHDTGADRSSDTSRSSSQDIGWNNSSSDGKNTQTSAAENYAFIEPAAGTGGDYYLDRNDVKVIQHALMDKGYRPGPADGVWGRRTEDAFRLYQSRSGMQSDGRVTQSTLADLGVRVKGSAIRYESSQSNDINWQDQDRRQN